MVEYNFPKDLYVRMEEIQGGGIKAEVYKILEQEASLVHMKRVGLIWLRDSKDFKDLEKRLNDKSSWDTKD